MKQPVCITFAAPVGSSKTPISNYLSGKLNLPIYNSDAVRSEIIEDEGFLDEEKFYQTRDKRIKDILERKISFILDTSVDRRWKQLKEWLERYNYKWIIISIDLNKDFLAKLYKAKGYVESLQRIDKILADHKKFLQKFSAEVNIWINEENFAKRLEICYRAIKKITND
jgi:hypothetical protein